VEPEGPKLNHSLRAEAKITNWGSGTSSGAGSFLFIKDFIEKIMVAEKDFVNCYNFHPFRVKPSSILVK
jgi:hypothetical protein